MRVFNFFLVLMVLSVSSFFGLLYIKVDKIYSSDQKKTHIFRVNQKESIQSISKRLKEKKLILSSNLFEIGARLKKLDKKIKYGEFSLTNKMSIVEILNKISSYDYLKYDIYVKDCITNWELVSLLEKKYFLVNDLANDTLVEGEFAPNTYKVDYNTRFTDLLEVMRLKQDQILTDEWSKRKNDLPLKNNYELLILASIIEKEAADISEMPLIASVFVNRLRKGMRLQSDPTVSYGLDLGNISKRKPLKKIHFQNHNLHNTYRISGLPESPICNPSRSAIRAAANPDTSDFFYFVMSESGQHIFSETFDEHKLNVINWRKYKKIK